MLLSHNSTEHHEGRDHICLLDLCKANACTVPETQSALSKCVIDDEWMGE